MSAMETAIVRPEGHRPVAGSHWAKRPLPEPPRSRRVSKWATLPVGSKADPLADPLEEWLRENSVSYTYDGD